MTQCSIHADEKIYKPLVFGKEVNGFKFGYCDACQGLVAVRTDPNKTEGIYTLEE